MKKLHGKITDKMRMNWLDEHINVLYGHCKMFGDDLETYKTYIEVVMPHVNWYIGMTLRNAIDKEMKCDMGIK